MAVGYSCDLFVRVDSKERWDYFLAAGMAGTRPFMLEVDVVEDSNDLDGVVHSRWDYESQVISRWRDSDGNIIVRTIDGDTIALIPCFDNE